LIGAGPRKALGRRIALQELQDPGGHAAGEIRYQLRTGAVDVLLELIDQRHALFLQLLDERPLAAQPGEVVFALVVDLFWMGDEEVGDVLGAERLGGEALAGRPAAFSCTWAGLSRATSSGSVPWKRRSAWSQLFS
jgi:hypothetical protein